MAATKTVSIFTGFVSEAELERDMGTIKRSLGKLRSIFAARGVRLRTDRCDSDDPAEIRAAISESDLCVFLFQTEVPALARAQFDEAYAELVAGTRAGAPAIFVWFRDAEEAALTPALRAFQEELDHGMGHFYNRYAEVDTVQFQLLLHLERMGAGVPFACVGTTLVDARGTVVMDFTHTAAYAGNEMLRAIQERRSELEGRYEALLDREYDEGPGEEGSSELDELVAHIAEVTEEERALQERFLADMRRFVGELVDDRQMSPRRRQAIRLISAGRVREGYALLDAGEIERDARTHEARAEAARLEQQSERAQVLDAVKSLLMRVALLRTFVEEDGEVKDEEIRQTYAVAIGIERRQGFEPLAAVGYAGYLVELGVFDRAIDQLDAACAWYRKALDALREAELTGAGATADPLWPGESGLRDGLGKALALLVRANLGADAAAAAAYAASERVEVLRGLYAPDGGPVDALSLASCLTDAAEALQAADRTDDALGCLDEAVELLCEARDEAGEPAPAPMGALVRALEARRDLVVAQGRMPALEAATARLIDELRIYAQVDTRGEVEAQLARELRGAAHALLDRAALEGADDARVRALADEALGLERTRYERQPSADTALQLVEGLRQSQVIAARQHDNEAFTRLAGERLDTLSAELGREACVEVQKAAGETVRDIVGRWRTRRHLQLARELFPRLSMLALALKDAPAPGEDSFALGCAVGDAVAGALAMAARACGADSSEVRTLWFFYLGRLRAGVSTLRGAAVYSGAFERLAWRLREEGEVAQAFGLTSERLCALRLACGVEQKGEPGAVGEDAHVDGAGAAKPAFSPQPGLVRQLVRALRFELRYARAQGRLAEGHAYLLERVALLRDLVAATGELADAYLLNGSLIELAGSAWESGDRAGFEAYLEEALGRAVELDDAQQGYDSLRNLLYVGKRVYHAYRDAGMGERATQVLRLCVGRLTAWCATHATPEVHAWAAHVAWMNVAELERAGDVELRDWALRAYGRLAGELARLDAPAYLAYLQRHLNNMVLWLPDELRREVLGLSVEAASTAYGERAQAGNASLDEARTLSSVFELGVLTTLEYGYDDQAEDYLTRCTALYEERLARAREGEQGALSVRECSLQLSKELKRLAESMRRFGHAERGDELWQRSTDILRGLSEERPGSRVSFIYSSQLHNESLRLGRAGDGEASLALREESVRVLDRYRQADPTERNFLWYTRSVGQLVGLLRACGRGAEADELERAELEAFDDRYQALHERQVLQRYLEHLLRVENRLHRAGDDGRALELLERGAFLAQDDFRRHGDVTAARPLVSVLGALWYLHKELGNVDEMNRVGIRLLELRRFLFARVPSLKLARSLAETLYGRERFLRAEGRRTGDASYLAPANELHNERIEVLRWAARRDRETARELATLIEGEVSVRTPDEPWLLRRMANWQGVGHNYPPELGEDRARVCLEALSLLLRDADGAEVPGLAEELRDMRGVFVQFLVHRRRDGEAREADGTYLPRLAEADEELTALLHELERDYKKAPDEATAGRLAFYLKLAAQVREKLPGHEEEALRALDRRARLLAARAEAEGTMAAGMAYARSLRDEASFQKHHRLIDQMRETEATLRTLATGLLARDDVEAKDALWLREKVEAPTDDEAGAQGAAKEARASRTAELRRATAIEMLARAEAIYAQAEGTDERTGLAQGLKEALEGASAALAGLDAGREARWLDVEAATCTRRLGKPGFAWWRAGQAEGLGRPWQRADELAHAQTRLSRASHLLSRSLTLGDWDEDVPNRRNLRNLMALRQQAYRKDLDAADQVRKLGALRWCLHNAANLLRRRGVQDAELLRESLVLRCELLEVLFDLARLAQGTESQDSARQEYEGEIEKLARQLQGAAWQDDASQGVRAWALGLAGEGA